ncbi:hypothetical protein EMPS_00342 [Entomortierella parvispora]|uniref:Extracellular membrane protein CFEM domain-containing protein n=1 Tax=Entomortierella parvispora TaxID=205924 RepID=A0A9P3H0L4_9FUNG|nr:hypothetical protein EMPS_00342 [Entomortierella parvispora]
MKLSLFASVALLFVVVVASAPVEQQELKVDEVTTQIQPDFSKELKVDEGTTQIQPDFSTELKVDEGTTQTQPDSSKELKVDEGTTQTRPDFSKEDGVIPILGPATPLACKIVTTVLNGLCALANYNGCEATINYAQCICGAQNDRAKILACANNNLLGLIGGHCFP